MMPLIRGLGDQVFGNLSRIDYILYSKVLRSFDISVSRELDLGSDHRCVSASIEYVRLTEAWQTWKRSFKGCKPIRDEARQPHEYHSHLEEIDERLPSCILTIIIGDRNQGSTTWRNPAPWYERIQTFNGINNLERFHFAKAGGR